MLPSNDGRGVNHEAIQPLWGEEGLRVVVKLRHKRTRVSDLPNITKAEAPGDVWTVGFQFHLIAAGKPLKILSIVDQHAREASGRRVEYSITASDLADKLDVLTVEHGCPRALRMTMDQGLSGKPFADALKGWS